MEHLSDLLAGAACVGIGFAIGSLGEIVSTLRRIAKALEALNHER